MKCLLVLLLAIAPAWASLETFHVKNLDLDYVLPHGTGTLEKLSVGVSKIETAQNTFPVEIYRRDDAFDVIAPFISFQWLDPYSVVHDLDRFAARRFNLTLGKGEHHLQGEELKITPEGDKTFVMKKFFAVCSGNAIDRNPVDRVLKDCREKMDATVDSLDLPTTFFTDLVELSEEKPVAPETDLPAKDFGLEIEKGDFFTYVQVKFIVRAYMRGWGHMQYEDNGKTLAIRVDKVHFGIIPITTLFMSELRRRVKHERIKIDPPWIRLNLED